MKTGIKILAAAGFLAFIAGCGALGEKDKPRAFIEFGDDKKGCLNNLGSNVSNYLVGQVDAKSWGRSFDCLIETLELFEEFVQPEKLEGYTRRDLKELISRILITDSQISDALIAHAFDLKASILGGSNEILSFGEVDRLMGVLRTLQFQSLALLPHLKTIQESPSADELLEFYDALTDFGDEVGRKLGSEGSPTFTQESIIGLTQEINTLKDINLPIEQIPLHMSIKKILTAGPANGIEGGMWERVVALGAEFIAAVQVTKKLDREMLKKPNEYGEFLHRLVRRIEKMLVRSIRWNQDQVIPLAKIDQVIDDVPDDWLKFNDKVLNRSILKSSLRTILTKLFWAGQDDAITPQSISTPVGLFFNGQRSHTHIENIFESGDLSKQSVSTVDFVNSAQSYLSGLTKIDDQASVQRIIRLAEDYVPLYREGKREISFEYGLQHSMNNLVMISWLNLAAQHIVQSYSKEPARDRVNEEDIKELLDDIAPLGAELGVYNTDANNTETTFPQKKRLAEADLFTWGGNGDGWVNTQEATYLVSVLLSIGTSANRVRDSVGRWCTCRSGDPMFPTDFRCLVDGGAPIIADPNNPVDPLGWDWMVGSCFEEEFFPRFRALWSNMPHFVDEYAEYPPNKKEKVQNNMGKSARRCGRQGPAQDYPYASFDTQNTMGIIHYVESLMSRFDTNGNGVLNTQETLRAYPVLKKTIKKQFKDQLCEVMERLNFRCTLDPGDDWNQALLTYIVDRGKKPELADAVDFLAWKIRGPSRWEIRATRFNVYKIIGLFTVQSNDPGCVIPNP